jgi:hypothetical protein
MNTWLFQHLIALCRCFLLYINDQFYFSIFFCWYGNQATANESLTTLYNSCLCLQFSLCSSCIELTCSGIQVIFCIDQSGEFQFTIFFSSARKKRKDFFFFSRLYNFGHQHYYVLLKTKWFIKTVILAIWVYILLSLTHNCWILILKSIPDNRQQIS